MAKQVENASGYVHEVSEVKIGGKTGTRYFDFRIQQDNAESRVVCFSPSKREDIKDREQSKSPTRLVNVSCQKRKRNEVEFLMNKYSRIEEDKDLHFPWKDIASGKVPTSATAISDVVHKIEVGDVVNVEVLVHSKSATQVIHSTSLGKELKKSSLIVADSTAAIPMALWEDKINDVNENKSYLFQKVRVSYYKHKYLSCCPSTEIKQLDDNVVMSVGSAAEVAKLKEKVEEIHVIDGKVIGVEVTKAFICLNCKDRKIPYNVGSSVVACPTCNISLLLENLQVQLNCNMMIRTESTKVSQLFYCPGDVLASFFALADLSDPHIKGDIGKISPEKITATLLNCKKLSFNVDLENKVVKCIAFNTEERIEVESTPKV